MAKKKAPKKKAKKKELAKKRKPGNPRLSSFNFPYRSIPKCFPVARHPDTQAPVRRL